MLAAAGTGALPIGWSVAPAVKSVEVDADPGALAGLQVALVLDGVWLVGTGWYGFASPGLEVILDGDGRRLEGGYGGLVLGRVLWPESRVHGLVGVLAGGGMLAAADTTETSPAFVVIEPAAYVEATVAPWVRLAAGASWRWTGGVRYGDLRDGDLAAPGGELLVRIGPPRGR
jgi:hypothetical protein